MKTKKKPYRCHICQGAVHLGQLQEIYSERPIVESTFNSGGAGLRTNPIGGN